MLHHLVEAVIRGLVLVGRRHGVPGDASTRDVVERVEDTRAVERMMVRGRKRQGEADAWRGFRHQRDHRRHVVARPLRAVAHNGFVVAAVILRRAAGVAEKQHIHDTALGDAGDVLVEFRRSVVGIADPRTRHAPEIVGVQKRQISRKMDRLTFRQSVLLTGQMQQHISNMPVDFISSSAVLRAAGRP